MLASRAAMLSPSVLTLPGGWTAQRLLAEHSLHAVPASTMTLWLRPEQARSCLREPGRGQTL